MTQQHRWLFHFGTLSPAPKPICRNGITDAGFATKRMLVYMVRSCDYRMFDHCASGSQCRSARDLLAPRGNRFPTPDSGCDYLIIHHAGGLRSRDMQPPWVYCKEQRCSVLITRPHRCTTYIPLPSNTHHQRCGDCLEGKRENYQVCSVQYCVQQLCTVRCTHIWTD